jgi:hypothetical protein
MTASDQSTLMRATTSAPFPWLFAYFRQIYSHRVDLTPDGVQLFPLSDQELLVEALHLAYSYDGRNWTPLNNNRPIMADGTKQRIRDPFISRGRDGQFHLVATGGATATGMYYARSSDLITWVDRRSMPVMDQVPDVRNVCAPEFIFDPQHNNYLVYWSSSHGRHGWDDSRIWGARTDDFQAFSTPKVLFDPGFTVIDATIMPLDDTYFMFFKDERFGHAHGEHRYIQVASSLTLDGPYKRITDAITPSITEGPAVIRPPDSDHWYLMYDHCMDNRYGLSLSPDLLNWQTVDNVHFPPNARRGDRGRVVQIARALGCARRHR